MLRALIGFIATILGLGCLVIALPLAFPASGSDVDVPSAIPARLIPMLVEFWWVLAGILLICALLGGIYLVFRSVVG